MVVSLCQKENIMTAENQRCATIGDIDTACGRRVTISIAILETGDQSYIGRFRSITEMGHARGRFTMRLDPFGKLFKCPLPSSLVEHTARPLIPVRLWGPVEINSQPFVVLGPEIDFQDDEVHVLSFRNICGKRGRIFISSRQADILATQELLGKFTD